MGNIGLQRRINQFMEGKQREMPELRDKDIDELIQDLAREGRSASVF